jgi:hypothetical protein
MHEVLPRLVEASDVADAAHAAVAAHWVAKSDTGSSSSGTYTFRFNSAGRITKILGYVDASEDEYLEA